MTNKFFTVNRAFVALTVAVAMTVCSFSVSAQQKSLNRRFTKTTIESLDNERPQFLSIYHVLLNPQSHVGKRVQIAGYLSASFESFGIYASRDAYRFGVLPESVGLWLDPEEKAVAERLNGKFVLIQGTIKAGGKPDEPISPVTMLHITRLRSLE